jgi:DNA-binding IclR family transcriptional regulator
VYVDVVESRNVIRYFAPQGVRRRLYPTRAGKCFLAHFSSARQDRYLQRQGYDASAREAIDAELVEVRSRGYSINRGETVRDVFAVSSPIVVAGKIVAYLTSAGPDSRFEPKIDAIARSLVDAAARLAQSRG